ncbi:hypothetical protein L7F22_004415 [Adiantum nelumboides]|nr:hypothetical protein [Adiantum nelumboides]
MCVCVPEKMPTCVCWIGGGHRMRMCAWEVLVISMQSMKLMACRAGMGDLSECLCLHAVQRGHLVHLFVSMQLMKLMACCAGMGDRSECICLHAIEQGYLVYLFVFGCGVVDKMARLKAEARAHAAPAERKRGRPRKTSDEASTKGLKVMEVSVTIYVGGGDINTQLLERMDDFLKSEYCSHLCIGERG